MSKNRISWLDVKLGARMLVKHPGLTVVGGLAIAVAVAVSTSMFTFIHSSLLPVLPLPEGDRIVALENWDTKENNEERRALRDLAVWRTELRSVRDVAAFRDLTRNLIGPGGPPEPVEVAEMTASGFRVARVPPLLGRYLVAADELSSAPPVVVIGHDVWQERFAGDPGVIGRSIRLGSSMHTVVGVMPERFGFPVSHNIWVPLRLDPALFEPKSGPEIYIFGRLAPGATREQAQAELTTLGKRAAAASPATHAQLEPRVLKYTEPILDIQGMTVWQTIPMQLAVTLLLVIVAANVSILVYARTASRHGELAVRSALGASRARIVTQLFAEMLLLAGGASLVGLAISQVGLRLVDRLMYNDLGTGTPFWTDYSVSPLTVAWVVLLAIFTAAVAGVVPALTATGRRLQDSLRRVSGG
ncbi:MAG TPA: ABC transporter permease, partial [Longimicrobium sp.]